MLSGIILWQVPQVLERIRPRWIATTLRCLDQWLTWGVVGLAIGLALGANTVAVWLVAIGMFAFLAYLSVHGPARRATEGALFAAGSVFMVAWIVGFIIRGIVSETLL